MNSNSEVSDTSKTYDSLLDLKTYVNPGSLTSFIDESEPDEIRPSIKPKPVDKDFPEQWQNLYVNFNNEKDFLVFMTKIGITPGPKTSVYVFNKTKDDGLLSFME